MISTDSCSTRAILGLNLLFSKRVLHEMRVIVQHANFKLQTAGTGEGCWIRVGTTEATVKGHWLLAATFFKDVATE